MGAEDDRIVVEPHPGRVRVLFHGRTVVDSRRALSLREAGRAPVLYLPREDADAGLLERTSHRTRCPYKGEAAYFSLRVGDEVAENAVWSYEQPIPQAAAIAGHLAFYPDKVEIVADPAG